MNILPDKNTYSDLVGTSSRVPICGHEKISGLDMSVLFKNLFHDSENTFLFESSMGPDETAHYSLMGKAHSRILEITGSRAKLYSKGQLVSEWDQPDEALTLLNFEENVRPVDYLPHFWGGWVGIIGYEAGEWFETLPHRESSENDIPDLLFMEIDRFYLYDHVTEELKFILCPQVDSAVAYDDLKNDIKKSWKEIYQALMQVVDDNLVLEKPNLSQPLPTLRDLKSNLSQDEYIERVKRAKNYISEGDIYQANLAQKFETPYSGHPFELYRKLRQVNPAPFSGYLNFNDFSLVSSSPERLVKVHENCIETRPIAGTRPRGQKVEDDHALSKELLLNIKERAEHLMLVDLERNDLGRVANSISVTDFMFLEKYSHVSHIVSNIAGTLDSEASVYDILKAVFPGGTITGCPKIRCMEIISELEPVRRGPYSGSFGYIGYGLYMDLNIIIRSIVISGEIASFHVGAGIVADSDPQKEYQETLDKAAAMIQALSH